MSQNSPTLLPSRETGASLLPLPPWNKSGVSVNKV